LLHDLRAAPEAIAADMRRGSPAFSHELLLDARFVSCLGLAKSTHNIVKDAECGRYRDTIRLWRTTALDDKERTQFNRMAKLRDIDVHHGLSHGGALATFIPARVSKNGMYRR
jgi:hypothetical protein